MALSVRSVRIFVMASSPARSARWSDCDGDEIPDVPTRTSSRPSLQELPGNACEQPGQREHTLASPAVRPLGGLDSATTLASDGVWSTRGAEVLHPRRTLTSSHTETGTRCPQPAPKLATPGAHGTRTRAENAQWKMGPRWRGRGRSKRMARGHACGEDPYSVL